MPPKATPVHESYNHGDLVLGRIKGYPWWPGKVIDPSEPNLRKAVTEGKPGKKTAFLVRYYDDGDYSWLEPKDMKPLSMAEIETFVGKGQKPSALKKAYQTAQHPEEWEKKHRDNLAARAARGDVDDEEEDEEDEAPPKKKQRKSAPAESKTKAKATTVKKETESKAKKDDKKNATDANEPEVAKLCRGWRSKLQRAFLSGKEAPKPEDLPSLDEVFTAMEAWEPDQAGLEPSKLPKVLKRIPLVEYEIPDEAKYRFKERSTALLAKWQSTLGGSSVAPTPTAGLAPSADSAAPEVSPGPAAKADEEEPTNGDTTMLTEVDTSMVDASNDTTASAATETVVPKPAEETPAPAAATEAPAPTS